MSWLRRLFGGRERESAGGVGAWGGDVEGDPRGGMQDETYRTADPRDVVDAGVAMSGPGGAPQEDVTPAERRESDR